MPRQSRCPKCGSGKITARREVLAPAAWIELSRECLVCGWRWQELTKDAKCGEAKP